MMQLATKHWAEFDAAVNFPSANAILPSGNMHMVMSRLSSVKAESSMSVPAFTENWHFA
jgi:hypothetical protein